MNANGPEDERGEGGYPEIPGIPEIEPTEVPEPPEWEYERTAPSEPKPKVAPPTKEAAQRGMGLALAIGYSFVGPVVLGVLIGTLLDGKAGGTWTLVGLLAGTVVAFVLLVRLVNKLNES